MKHLSERVLSLRCVFRHHDQARSHNAPFFIAHIAGVWFSVPPHSGPKVSQTGRGATRHACLSLFFLSFFKNLEQTLVIDEECLRMLIPMEWERQRSDEIPH